MAVTFSLEEKTWLKVQKKKRKRRERIERRILNWMKNRTTWIASFSLVKTMMSKLLPII